MSVVCRDARANLLSAGAVMDDHLVTWSKNAAVVTVISDGTPPLTAAVHELPASVKINK